MVTSDRIAVMNHGRIEAWVDHPARSTQAKTRFVAASSGAPISLRGLSYGGRFSFDGFALRPRTDLSRCAVGGKAGVSVPAHSMAPFRGEPSASRNACPSVEVVVSRRASRLALGLLCRPRESHADLRVTTYAAWNDFCDRSTALLDSSSRVNGADHVSPLNPS